jgi:L-seryl-tRNA(Ser) seleniumtransferase
MIGTIAALEAWEKRDHAAVRARETSYLQHWQDRLSGRRGVKVEILPDPTHNPLDRMLVTVDPAEARITAWDLADALARGNPPVIVRDHEVELGHFFLDPCNLHPGEAEIVADRIIEELEVARRSNETIETPVADRARRRYAALQRWPD